MAAEIWGIASCDSCRKARAALPAARFRDIRAEPLTTAEIAAVLERFGEAAVNRASTTWRGLSEAERGLPASQLLARHATLLKRPVISVDGAVHLGFGAAVRAELGLS